MVRVVQLWPTYARYYYAVLTYSLRASYQLSDAHVHITDIDLHAPRSVSSVISLMRDGDFGAKSALIYTECVHERMRSNQFSSGSNSPQPLS